MLRTKLFFVDEGSVVTDVWHTTLVMQRKVYKIVTIDLTEIVFKQAWHSVRSVSVLCVLSIEAMCWVDYKYVVGAAPTGDAANTSEWSAILLPTKVRLRGLTVHQMIYCHLLTVGHLPGPWECWHAGLILAKCRLSLNHSSIHDKFIISIWGLFLVIMLHHQ